MKALVSDCNVYHVKIAIMDITCHISYLLYIFTLVFFQYHPLALYLVMGWVVKNLLIQSDPPNSRPLCSTVRPT